jgi:hypothetical protein
LYQAKVSRHARLVAQQELWSLEISRAAIPTPPHLRSHLPRQQEGLEKEQAEGVKEQQQKVALK